MAEEKTISLPELFCEVENMSVFYNLKRATDSTNNIYVTGKSGVLTYGTPDIRWEQITFIKSEKLIYTRGVLYGKTDSNITEDDITVGDYVDLGLPSGTLWATCNLGATKPYEYGLLYQFGRVDGYAYGDTNNRFRTKRQNEEDTGNPYSPLTTSGNFYDNGEVLDPEDDAAYVASNGVMRMPTEAECQELIDNTTSQWVSCKVMGGEHTSHNVMGLLFKSTKNNNTLFLPAAGYFNGDNGSFILAGSNCCYWSSSIHESDYFYKYCLENHSEYPWVTFKLGYYGFSVRGVFKINPLKK